MHDRVLIVDDEQDECDQLARLTRHLDYDPICTTSPDVALDLVGKESVSAILTDLGMFTLGGLELCARIMGARPDVPVIVVTALGSIEAAVEAMRAGAYDFLNKPVDANALGLALRRAVQHHRLKDQVRLLSVPNGDREILSLEELEKRYIMRALKIVDGNRSRAATLLGVDRRTLYRKLDRYSGANGTAPERVPEAFEQ
jgi:DNA-binding NtrC family response regulator